jgi:lactate dehydrogenase-like 2-hydroxyacid dehydrogenase
MARPTLLQTGPMMPLIQRGIDSHFEAVRIEAGRDPSAILREFGPRIEAVCTGGHTGVKTDEALLAQLPKARIIANFGVGYDSIEMPAAARRGIVVTNTPDVLNEEVADTALGLLLMTVRELGQAEQWLRQGRWAREGDYRLTPGTLRDRKVGMVGFGRIGKAIAKRIEAFGVPVAYFARNRQADVANRYYASLVEMAKDCDTLIVITPGGPSTRHLINAEVLGALGARGILINVARGSVVDEAALKAALRGGTIFAAGLDVYMNEPRIDPELLELPNTVLLPHVGSASAWTRDKMGQLVVDNLAAYVARKSPPTPVPETPFKGW